jgi:hypothetical protein
LLLSRDTASCDVEPVINFVRTSLKNPVATGHCFLVSFAQRSVSA